MKAHLIAVVTATALAGSAMAFDMTPAQQQVAEHFKTKEPAAKDATWTAKSIFKVGVLDNGSSRDGYAEYVCNVLYDYGFKGERVTVHVIDIAALVRQGEWNKLGSARCL